MVKLRVAARIIPEDAYLASVEAAGNTPIRGEKRFPVIVRNPDEWFIGRLALEIKASYARLYKHDLGAIKYLKDDEDDCDLDPELLVSDLLVNEGKAANDGGDQKVTIKVIQEQGRALREGSVIPDLTPAHFQPTIKPPVPKFPNVTTSLGKRAAEDDFGVINGTREKRIRSGVRATDVENEDILDSIEGDAVRESPEVTIQNSQPVRNALAHDIWVSKLPKIESPELSTSWRQFPPTGNVEQPLSPEVPSSFPKAHSNGHPLSNGMRSTSRAASKGLQERHITPVQAQGANVAPPESDAASPGRLLSEQPEHRLPHSTGAGPITPPYESSRVASGSANAVSVLNSLKRPSPLAGSTSASSRRFVSSTRDVYAYPESDIEDSQMSPRSRAAATMTPRLIPSAKKSRPASESRSPTKDRSRVSDVSDLMEDVQSAKTLELSKNKSLNNLSTASSPSPASSEDNNTSTHESAAEMQADVGSDNSSSASNSDNENQAVRASLVEDHVNGLDSSVGNHPRTNLQTESSKVEETAMIPAVQTGNSFRQSSMVHARSSPRQEPTMSTPLRLRTEGKRKKRTRMRKVGKNSDFDDNTSTTQSIGSGSNGTTQQRGLNGHDSAVGDQASRTKVTATVQSLRRDSTPALDSPGEQLSQTLQESTRKVIERASNMVDVTKKKSAATKTNTVKGNSQKEKVAERSRGSNEQEQLSETGRMQSESERSATPSRQAGAKSVPALPKAKDVSGDLRCLACWKKTLKCDRVKPKCGPCTKRSKNCQAHDLSKSEAMKIVEDERAEKAEKAEKLKKKPVKAVRTKPTVHVNAERVEAETVAPTKKPSEIEGQNVPIEEDRETVAKSSIPLPHWGFARKEATTLNSSQNKPSSPDRPTESSVAHRRATLPPGMTQEEYDRIVQSRLDLTQERREAEKEALRKQTTGSISRKTPSRSSEPATVPPASQSKDESQQPSSRATRTPSAGPVENTSKKNGPATTPKSAIKPRVAASSASKKSTPSFSTTKSNSFATKTQTLTPKTKSMAPPLSSSISKPTPRGVLKKTTAPPDISQVKSLQSLRSILSSSSNSPAPTKPSFATAQQANIKDRNRRISFRDEDDDSESESDSDDDSAVRTAPTAKPSGKTSALSVRRPDQSIRDVTPADSDDDD